MECSESMEMFLAENPPRGKKFRSSVLDDYRDDIFLLRSKGYSYSQVRKFLEEMKNISITEAAICNFFNKNNGKK